MDAKRANDLFDLVWGIIADAFKYSNENATTVPTNESLKDFFVRKVDEKEASEVEKTQMMQMAEMWGAFVGDPLERQSLKYFWMEECIDGENLFVASTYKDIMERVARAAISNAHMHLDTEVESIEAKHTIDGEPNVLVRTKVAKFEFDEVVVTVPLGCLKMNTPRFSPPLTPRILRAIINLSYGHLEKVYITFSTAFWDSPSTTESESDSETFSFFSHFLSPTYSPTNPDKWNIEIVSLSASTHPKSFRHPTLLFYIHGPCSAYITAGIKQRVNEKDYFQFLDEFFHPYYSRLPNYTPTKACQPLAILATDWSNDELAGYGAYTNFQVSEPVDEGEEEAKLDEDVEALRHGMPERGIWLAGEHTAPFVALGTVTGAYWSGERVARRLLAAYGLGGEVVQN
ncbi:MAG: hypothetical protein MMC33_006282 [Icmadophila ericetorum]|nr:hypothetical protein [Icmadophila ericetorum]